MELECRKDSEMTDRQEMYWWWALIGETDRSHSFRYLKRRALFGIQFLRVLELGSLQVKQLGPECQVVLMAPGY